VVEWRAGLIRGTAFFRDTTALPRDDWWSAIVGSPPAERVERARDSVYQEHGPIDAGLLVLARAPLAVLTGYFGRTRPLLRRYTTTWACSRTRSASSFRFSRDGLESRQRSEDWRLARSCSYPSGIVPTDIECSQNYWNDPFESTPTTRQT